MGRGGREGNNAFVADITHEEEFSDYLVDKLMEMPEIDPEMV
jgi:hypothetical protein